MKSCNNEFISQLKNASEFNSWLRTCRDAGLGYGSQPVTAKTARPAGNEENDAAKKLERARERARNAGSVNKQNEDKMNDGLRWKGTYVIGKYESWDELTIARKQYLDALAAIQRSAEEARQRVMENNMRILQRMRQQREAEQIEAQQENMQLINELMTSFITGFQNARTSRSAPNSAPSGTSSGSSVACPGPEVCSSR